MAVPCNLGKGERLVREQHIEALFRNGKAFSVHPLRVIYQVVPKEDSKEHPILAGFSASKKKFKKAVDRNRVKRLMREAWRLQKGALFIDIQEDMQLQLFLICTSSQLPSYQDIYSAVDKAIKRLRQVINTPPDA